MSAILSSFMSRNSKSSSKWKNKKYHLNLPSPRAQSPPSPGSFASPEIVDANEKVITLRGKSKAPPRQDEESYDSYDSTAFNERSLPRNNLEQLMLNLHSEPMNDWYTVKAEIPETLGGSYHRLNGSGSVGSGRGGRSNISREAFESEEVVGLSQQTVNHIDVGSADDLDRQSLRKHAPAPIKIPSVAAQRPKVQVRRSDSHDIAITNIPETPQTHPDSPLSVATAASGTTLARALLANSYTLSNDADASAFLYRGGLSATGTRQDSATLPRGEYSFLNSPYWRDKRISGGDIIMTPVSGRNSAVPPMPSASGVRVKRSRSARSSGVTSEMKEKGRRQSGVDLKRRASGSSLHTSRMSGVEPKPPRSPRLSSAADSEHPPSRRITRIMEMSSPTPSTPGAPHRGVDKSLNKGITPPSASSSLTKPGSGKATSSEYDTPSSSNPQSSIPQGSSLPDSPMSPDFGLSIEKVLDGYMLQSSPRSGPSTPQLAPESSASITPPAPYRSTPKRASKKRKSSKIMYRTNSSSIAAGKGRGDLVPQKDPDTHRHAQDNLKVKLLPIGERPGSLLLTPTLLTPASPTSGSLPLSPGVRVTSTPPSVTFNARYISGLDTPMKSPDILDGKLLPISRLTRQRSGSSPAALKLIREPKDISHFNITIGSDHGSPQNTPSTGSGHQTFPETPYTAALWSSSTAGGSPGATVSPTSSPTFIPGHSKSASLSGPMQGSRPNLTQQVLLFRATTVAGNRSLTDTSKLQTVAEVAEARPASTVPSHSQSPSSLNRPPSGKLLSDRGDTAAPVRLLPPMPSTTPISQLGPHIQVQNAESHPSAAETEPRPLPNISQTSPRSSLSGHSLSPTARSRSPSHTSSPFLSACGPLPDQPSIQRDSLLPPGVSASGATVLTTNDLTKLPSLDSRPAPTETQTSTPPESRHLSEADTVPYSHPFIAPPPYQAVVNNYLPTPLVSRQGSNQRDNGGASTVLHIPNINHPAPAGQSSIVRATRPRPPLPMGPRKPVPSPKIPATLALPEHNASVSSTSTMDGAGGSISSGGWRKLVAQCPSPKFQIPAPKFRGYTLEAAQWTFTSEQLQAIVSRAIKQSAEASSVRLLRLETLDTDIPAEMHRLEMQKTDLKGRYKHLTRKRWTLLGNLATHLEGFGEADSIFTIRILEDLADVSLMLDQHTEELDSVTEQLAQLRSIGDVHSASALAMALRKLNTSFLKQVTENQTLREQLNTLEAERDEAWKQAEDVAQEYDDLNDRYGEPSSFKALNNKRSSHVSAVRKSSMLVSRAGLRSASLRRSQRSSAASSGYRGSMTVPLSSAGDVPPVPPIPHQTTLGVLTADLPSHNSLAISSSSLPSGSTDMLRAQEELYDLLGISVGDTKGHRFRPRSVTGHSRHSRHGSTTINSPYARPLSDISTSIFRTSSIPGSARSNRFMQPQHF